jgi:hypothetical protein
MPLLSLGFDYFGLRDAGYTPRHIEQWVRTTRKKTSGRRDVFVYFKHEEAGKSPRSRGCCWMRWRLKPLDVSEPLPRRMVSLRPMPT